MEPRPADRRPAPPRVPDALLGAGNPGAWPRRLALATVLASIPLFAFGGSVTTMGAGMAVEGWWNAEGHFLPFFPIEKWFRNPGTFVEHTHRLFGMLVGLFAILLVVVTWRRDRRRSARTLVLVSLAAICAQGTLGGFRVLERSPELAFLHGAFAQGVFALLVATAFVLSPTWRLTRVPPRSGAEGTGSGRRLRRLGLVAAALVFAQVVVGAWYRHGLRPVPAADVEARFGLHALFALAVLLVVMMLGQALRARAAALDVAGAPGAPITPATRTAAGRATVAVAGRLQLLLGLQVVLGMCAWAAHRPEGPTLAEGALAVLHVLCGAALLAQTVVAALWAQRLEHESAPVAAAGRAGLAGLGSELGGAS